MIDPVGIQIVAKDDSAAALAAFSRNTEAAFGRTTAAAKQSAVAIYGVGEAAKKVEVEAGRAAGGGINKATTGIIAFGRGGEKAVKGMEKATMVAMAMSGGFSQMGAAAARVTSGLTTLALSGFNPVILGAVALSAALGVVISRHEEAAKKAESLARVEADAADKMEGVARARRSRSTGMPEEVLAAQDLLRKAEGELARRREEAAYGRLYTSPQGRIKEGPFIAEGEGVTAQARLVAALRKAADATALGARDAANWAIGEKESADAADAHAKAADEAAKAREKEKAATEALATTMRALDLRKQSIETGLPEDLLAAERKAMDFRNASAAANKAHDDEGFARLTKQAEEQEALAAAIREVMKAEEERRAKEKAASDAEASAREWESRMERIREESRTSAEAARKRVTDLEAESEAMVALGSNANEYDKRLAEIAKKEKEALASPWLTDEERGRVRSAADAQRGLVMEDSQRAIGEVFDDFNAKMDQIEEERREKSLRHFTAAGVDAGQAFSTGVVDEATRGILEGKADIEAIGTLLGQTVVHGVVNALYMALIGEQIQALFMQIFRGIPTLFGAAGGGPAGGGGAGGGPVFAPTDGPTMAPGMARGPEMRFTVEPAPVVTEEVFDTLPPERKRGFVTQAQSSPGRRGQGMR